MAKTIYISEPQPVSMADEWFKIADENHFWIKKRLAVTCKLIKKIIRSDGLYMEVGCGHGLLQQSLSYTFGCKIDGCDLNEQALRQNVSKQRCFYYNVNENNKEFFEKYDGVFVYDVLEHIENEKPFLQSLSKLVKKDGFLCFNVPALNFLYSNYDTKAGHFRRYCIQDLESIKNILGFSLYCYSFWGIFLIPIAFLRKIVLSFTKDENIIKIGFKPPNKILALGLEILEKIEPIPNKIIGTSLMFIFKK